MAANIEIRENGASFVSTQVEWHNLGKVFDAPLTTKVALEESHANFKVQKQPIVALTPEMVAMMEDGKFANMSILRDMIIQNSVATMRTDRNETLGIVGDSYGVVQNEDAFAFIDNLCTGGDGTPCIESAGVLGMGERVFVTAKFPEPIRLAHKDNDLVEMYIVFTTSHDGKGAVTAMVTPVRVVCNNTLNAAFHNNSGRWNVRHTSNVNNRLANVAEAARALKLYDVYKAEFEDKMSLLAKVHLTDNDVKRFAVRSLVSDDVWKVYVNSGYNIESDDISTKTKNQYHALMDTIYGGVGQNILETNTALHAYNGLTCYLDNVARNKDNEKQFNSVMLGTAYDKQQRGFNELIKLAV